MLAFTPCCTDYYRKCGQYNIQNGDCSFESKSTDIYVCVAHLILLYNITVINRARILMSIFKNYRLKKYIYDLKTQK